MENIEDCYVSGIDLVKRNLGQLINLDSINMEKIDPVNFFLLNNIYLAENTGSLFTEEGESIKEGFNYLYHLKNKLLPLLRYKNIKYQPCIELKDNTYLSLLGIWTDNFWHWTMDYLQKVIMAENLGFKGGYIVMPVKPFILESLKMLGISEKRIMIYQGQNLLIKDLLLPEYINVYDKRILPILSQVRMKFLSVINSEKPVSSRRIYISRKISKNGRKILNEEQIMSFLEKHGFEQIFMDNLPLEEQVRIASESNFLIGGHGAGITHSLFMKESSNIIEFFAPTYVHYLMMSIFKLLNHNYFPIVSQKTDPFSPYEFGYDINVPVDLFEMVFNRCI